MYTELIKTLKREGDKIKGIGPSFKNLVNKDYWFTKIDDRLFKKIKKVLSNFEDQPLLLSDQEPLKNFDDNKYESVWIVDPLSHGFSFIRDLPHYTIVVAHIVKGNIKFGFVYDPTTKECFKAFKSKGAFLNDEQIKVNTERDKICILFDYYPLEEQLVEMNFDLLRDLSKVARVKSYGSYATHYSYVAAGKAEVAITQNRDMYPEYAGKIIVEEAGGEFTDFNMNPINTQTKGILASNGKWHKKISKIVSNYQRK